MMIAGTSWSWSREKGCVFAGQSFFPEIKMVMCYFYKLWYIRPPSVFQLEKKSGGIILSPFRPDKMSEIALAIYC